MLPKSDRALKELFDAICKCKDNYNQHRQLCSSREKTHKELDDYRKELTELRKKYHYDEKTKKIEDLCLKINNNEIERYKKYLLAILSGYEYCESVSEETGRSILEKFNNFLLENGIWVDVPTSQIYDCIADVKASGIGDFDIVDHFVIGYACDNECQIPLEVINDNEFIGNMYNELKGLN